MEMETDSMSKYVNKVFIEIAINKGLKDIRDNSKRGVRNLVDLGKLFARGENQNYVFETLQKLLRDNNSIYYGIIDNLMEELDETRIKKFSYNLGYNGLLEGSKKIKKSSYNKIAEELKLDGEKSLDRQIAELKSQGLMIFLVKIEGGLDEYMEIFRENDDCIFFIFTSLDQEFLSKRQDYSQDDNLFFSFELEDNKLFFKNIRQLRQEKFLLGVHKYLNENNYKDLLSMKDIKTCSKNKINFLSYLEGYSLDESRKLIGDKVFDFICNYRWNGKYPVMLADLSRDWSNINRAIFN